MLQLILYCKIIAILTSCFLSSMITTDKPFSENDLEIAEISLLKKEFPTIIKGSDSAIDTLITYNIVIENFASKCRSYKRVIFQDYDFAEQAVIQEMSKHQITFKSYYTAKFIAKEMAGNLKKLKNKYSELYVKKAESGELGIVTSFLPLKMCITNVLKFLFNKEICKNKTEIEEMPLETFIQTLTDQINLYLKNYSWQEKGWCNIS